MNKDELLKIYSAYLLYDLQLQHKYEKAKHNGETVLRSWVKPLEPLDLGCLFPHRKDSFDWKPILYDLSYLTKEIEHDGERFVPTIWLRDNHAEFDISKADMEQLISMFIHVFRSPESAPYYFIKKLLQWHFNVFQLPESEYINKATLTNK